MTIDDIATAAGMSQRSVFRYFATKEEIVLGKFDPVVDDMLASLRARPADEPVWTSLQHVFDVLVSLAETPDHEQLAEPIRGVVFETPVLLAGYLQKLQRMQDAVVAELLERAEAAGPPYAATTRRRAPLPPRRSGALWPRSTPGSPRARRSPSRTRSAARCRPSRRAAEHHPPPAPTAKQ